MISVLCSSKLSAVVIDSVNSQKNSPNTIYVSSGAKVYISSNVSNIKIVKIKEGRAPEKIANIHKTSLSQVKQTICQKNSQNLELKILQEKIDKNVKNSFYSASHNNDLLKSSKLRFTSAATTPNLPFKFSKAFFNTEYDLSLFKIQNGKQKFYSSLSYLEFGKLRNSFLRGPPFTYVIILIC